MRTLSIATVLAVALAAPLRAQPDAAFPVLAVGQRASGQLSTGDPALYERGPFKVYRFQAEAGRRYVATLQSSDFDAYLTVARTVGGITDHMLMDDDGAGETNARLRFTAPASGTYLLIAQSLLPEGTGAFTVSVDTMPAKRLAIGDLRVGQTVTGELEETDREYGAGPGGGGFFDLYRVRGTPGQRLRLRMLMGDFFPALNGGSMAGDEFVPDAFGQGQGVLLLTLPPSGETLVQAGVEGEVLGEYTLTVADRGPAAAPRPVRLSRGQPVHGRLQAGDAENEEDGRWTDHYIITGSAGERIRVTMAAEAFDAYLSIGRMVDGAFQEIASNDDEGEQGTNSAVEVQLPEAGEYVIIATSFAPGGEGEYRIQFAAP
ncbi:hypothetical protein [Longimicrobium sp.]|jgi:hypothetical protein|uniref:hypothetical protein n=1 Tax=Longimicrobium sp. TaxID=2029185 RepID=UPI002F93E3DD